MAMPTDGGLIYIAVPACDAAERVARLEEMGAFDVTDAFVAYPLRVAPRICGLRQG